ncbi:MAG: SLATT domain-containing protein [Proteobacteria bacterium]|nr:SLATT domain-containing protein [Pseudomonadota bacterium]
MAETSAPPSPQPQGQPGTIGAVVPKKKKFMNGWTKEQERLMADWSDIAMCYRWLHNRSETYYQRMNFGITIPVIILSTLTGTANFGLTSIVGNDSTLQKYANLAIGGVSIITGILSTLGNFLRFAQLMESHRVASVSWGKFQRLVAVELALHPNDRLDCQDFLKICRQDLDRLIEQSPPIPDFAVKEFDNKFGRIRDIKKPDICNNLERTCIFVDNNTRLIQLASDAALMLKSKKNLLKELVLTDVERQISEKVDAKISEATVSSRKVSFLSLEEDKSMGITAVVEEKSDENTANCAVDVKDISGTNMEEIKKDKKEDENIVIRKDIYEKI